MLPSRKEVSVDAVVRGAGHKRKIRCGEGSGAPVLLEYSQDLEKSNELRFPLMLSEKIRAERLR